MLEAIHLQLLLATFAAWSNRPQARVITYLIEENRVLKEQLESGGRRLRLLVPVGCLTDVQVAQGLGVDS